MGARADSRSLGELFRKYGPTVCRRAHRILGNNADAQEATQEVFLRALRSADNFEGRSQITTWLYQITTHYCLDLLRNKSRRRELFEQHGMADERPESASASELLLLRQLLSEADEQQARAAVYVYLDGMSHDQAALLLGVSKRTVGNLIERFFAWAQKRSANPEQK